MIPALRPLALAGLILFLLPWMASSAPGPAGVYTDRQATRGQTVYRQECAKCHGETLGGGDAYPELAGSVFQDRWNGRTAADLFRVLKETMPTDNPGSLTALQYSDLTAFLFRANGLPAGPNEMPNDMAALNQIRLEWKR